MEEFHFNGIVGKNLQKFRKKRNLSLDHLSKISNVSKTMLTQIEKGRSAPSVTVLWKISKALDVHFSHLISPEESEESEAHKAGTIENLVVAEGKLEVKAAKKTFLWCRANLGFGNREEIQNSHLWNQAYNSDKFILDL